MDFEWLVKRKGSIVGNYDEIMAHITANLSDAENTLENQLRLYKLVPAIEKLPVEDIREGNISCHAPGKRAWFDSTFSCWIFQLPFFLENIEFGYICMPLIFGIILISIFGKIKENYRWFILNQAIWDAFVAYNFICRKPSFIQWFERYSKSIPDYKPWLLSLNQDSSTCIYSPLPYLDANSLINTIMQGFIAATLYSSYAPLFLLTFTRFLSIYFQYFHKKFDSILHVFLTIITFNVIFIFGVNIIEWGKFIRTKIAEHDYSECIKTCLNCNATNNCVQYIGRNPYPALQYIQIGIPPLLLLASVIFATLVTAKIFKQLKYQFQTNQKNFVINIRVASMIVFQCFTMTFLIFCTILQDILWIINNGDNQINYTVKQAAEKYIIETFPSWFRLLAFPATIQCLTVIRIFLDSIITIIILGEYRRSALLSAKFVILCFINPIKAFKKCKNYIFKNKEESRKIFAPRVSANVSALAETQIINNS